MGVQEEEGGCSLGRKGFILIKTNVSWVEVLMLKHRRRALGVDSLNR